MHIPGCSSKPRSLFSERGGTAEGLILFLDVFPSLFVGACLTSHRSVSQTQGNAGDASELLSKKGSILTSLIDPVATLFSFPFFCFKPPSHL